jgi:hypothetical protein
MGNFFQSGFWCLGEPQYAEKKTTTTTTTTELLADSRQYGQTSMEEPELRIESSIFL